jgi:nucleoid-associated protein YgaU
MRDPFRPNTNKQLVREAQFGFTVIGLLIAVLIYVAYFRINGLGDSLPQHIRDAPIAMHVFPNSPNYDRQSNMMQSRDSNPRVASTSNSPIKQKSPLVETPKRLLEDSNSTFRSLRKTAKSIESSAAKVQSLASIPVSKKSFGLISNPASETVEDSGFKIPKKPQPDIATSESSSFAPMKDPSRSELPPTQSNPIQSLLNKLKPKKPVRPKAELPTNKPSNDFKPNSIEPVFAEPSSIESNSAESNTKPATVSAPAVNPLLANLNDVTSGFAPLRTPQKTPTPDNNTLRQSTKSLTTSPKFPPALRQPIDRKPETESPSPAVVTPMPKSTIETVSFEETTWTVKKGDSFWSIAQSQYGDGRFFRALYEQNRRNVPGFENLTEGTELFLPSVDELIRRNPSLCPADYVRKNDPWRATPSNIMDDLTEACEADLDQRLYETKPGDTLFGIARQQLGQASRYVELLQLNEYRIDGNLNHESKLPPGTQLLLPIK